MKNNIINNLPAFLDKITGEYLAIDSEQKERFLYDRNESPLFCGCSFVGMKKEKEGWEISSPYGTSYNFFSHDKKTPLFGERSYIKKEQNQETKIWKITSIFGTERFFSEDMTTEVF